MWVGADILESITYALSWRFEIWKISIGVKDDAAVDALGYVFNHGLALVPIGEFYYIQREASALLVLLQWAIQSLESWDE